MGVVYEAKHETLGHRAAVKMLKPELSGNSQYRERFLREARACSKVQHPGLVMIIDCGELQDGQLYILMEYLEGVTLRKRLDEVLEHRLAIESALRMVQQIASAMDVAHRLEIVHRDLKPDNIMLVADPAAAGGERAKILDFGIAKFIGAAALPTLATTGIVGTPAYMAPERCRNDDNVDGKSDVYALGCMFYEMSCGCPPYDDLPAALLTQHVYGTIVPPRRREHTISPAVEALIMQMVRKDPAARPTMAEVESRIGYILSNPSRIRASRLTIWLGRKLHQYSSGMKLALVAGMLPLLLLVVLLASFFWSAEEKRIDGGEFLMGTNATQYAEDVNYVREGYDFYLKNDYLKREQPQHRVRLSPFMLDTTEITNERFAAWLKKLKSTGRLRIETITYDNGQSGEVASLVVKNFDGEQLLPLCHLSGGAEYNGIHIENGNILVRQGMERSPVSTVTWEGADSYCAAHGKRLPTEAEWEFAARSRGKYLYPWGNKRPNCFDAVIERGPEFSACRKFHQTLLPNVGSLRSDRTEQGIYDMAGSVSEWVADRFHVNYSVCDPFCQDPAVATDEVDSRWRGRRVIRGGAWSLDFPTARSTGRLSSKAHPDGDTGFRCARTVNQGG